MSSGTQNPSTDTTRDPADPTDKLIAQLRPQDGTILHVGCGSGRLGQLIKAARPESIIHGITTDPSAARQARLVLDRVDVCRLEDLPEVADASLDCIILSDTLDHVLDPVAFLRRLKPLLRSGGRLLSAIPNFQHFEVLASLLAGDFQRRRDGGATAAPVRILGLANVQKLFLDAGCLPRVPDSVRLPIPAETLAAYRPAIEHLRLYPDLFEEKASIRHFICVAEPLPEPEPTAARMTFVVAVNNERQLHDNLMASPIFHGDRHEVIPVTGAASAAEALTTGLSRSTTDNGIVALLHQDIYLPAGWDDRLISGLRQAEDRFGAVGIAGVFGVAAKPEGGFERAGRLVDRFETLKPPLPLPAEAVSLDEIALVFRSRSLAIESMKPELGFHMFGSEAALIARDKGFAAIIVDAPLLHNTESGHRVPFELIYSAKLFAMTRTAHFPYATTCLAFSDTGKIGLW